MALFKHDRVKTEGAVVDRGTSSMSRTSIIKGGTYSNFGTEQEEEPQAGPEEGPIQEEAVALQDAPPPPPPPHRPGPVAEVPERVPVPWGLGLVDQARYLRDVARLPPEPPQVEILDALVHLNVCARQVVVRSGPFSFRFFPARRL